MIDPTNSGGNWLARVLDGQRGRLFYWAPVLLGVGIGAYFALPFEPGPEVLMACAATVAALVVLAILIPAEIRPAPVALALIVAGLLLASGRAHWVAEPLLGFRYYGPIEGRIVIVDRSVSDKVRLTLDQVRLDRVSPARTPDRVRVSLHGEMYFTPEPGLRVMMTGHLSPPQGPVEPGGFDFRRMAWFAGLGAVGYTRSPALVAAWADPGEPELWVHRLRMKISQSVQEALPGRAGAFAAAVTTGDRSGMDREVVDDLRASNLSHLLAISGLHMGMLTGVVFASIRFFLALFPYVALRWPTKKLAAALAMLAGAFYYMLSGGNVATERAFIMVSVMFLGVLLDRRAITLRAVAIAALIVLLLRPETLISPGFQMSFAATTALVAVFSWMRELDGVRVPRFARPVLALVISSAVAGLATAPIAAAHFNRIADYGLLANLLSVPVMGLAVMPGAVLAGLLAPLGLEWVGLAMMKPAIDWILGVAAWVSDLEGAVTSIAAPGWQVLPLLALGLLWLILWAGPARWAGLAPVLVGGVLWAAAERPQALISESGALLGVLTDKGRALSKSKGDGFTALSWLENDGDPARQFEAASRGVYQHSKGYTRFDLGRFVIVQLRGKSLETQLEEACESADLIVSNAKLIGVAPCPVLDVVALRGLGAVALGVGPDGPVITGAKEVAGARLWAGQLGLR